MICIFRGLNFSSFVHGSWSVRVGRGVAGVSVMSVASRTSVDEVSGKFLPDDSRPNLFWSSSVLLVRLEK